MLREKIIKAWKDPEYRQGLSEEEREALPENPAGAIELTDEELDTAAGGHPPHPSWRASHSRSYRPSYSRSYGGSQSWQPHSRSWSNRPSRSWGQSYSRSYSYRR